MSTAWRLVLRRADDAHRVRLEQFCDNDGIVQKCAMRREENDALTLLIFFNTKTYNRKLPLWQVLEAVSVPGVSMSGQPVERNDRAFDDFARTCRPEDVRRHGAEQGRYQRAARPAVAAVASAHRPPPQSALPPLLSTQSMIQSRSRMTWPSTAARASTATRRSAGLTKRGTTVSRAQSAQACGTAG